MIMNQKGVSKLILILVVVVILVGGLGYYLYRKNYIPPFRRCDPSPCETARTLYTGYVKINSLSLSNIKAELEGIGCRPIDYRGKTESPCSYRETREIPYKRESGIEIYPRGNLGLGPNLSFYLTKEKLWATKDITGSPDPDKFKEAVRQDVQDIGAVVEIREGSWEIIETKYPWTANYGNI